MHWWSTECSAFHCPFLIFNLVRSSILVLDRIPHSHLGNTKLCGTFQTLKGNTLIPISPLQVLWRVLWLLYLFVWVIRAINLAKAVIMEKKFVYSKEDNIIDLSREGKLQEVSCTDVWYPVTVTFLLCMCVFPFVDWGPLNKFLLCANLFAYTLRVCVCVKCTLRATRFCSDLGWRRGHCSWWFAFVTCVFFSIPLISWVPHLWIVMSSNLMIIVRRHCDYI